MTASDAPVFDDGGLADLEDRSLTNDEFADLVFEDVTPVAITFTTQDFDVSGLVQRLQRGAMRIPSFGETADGLATAGFQRGFVWGKAQMDRFVESLLLGYPVPGIFLVRQTADSKLLILDGQQRLVTLQRFYEGLHAGREFALEYVDWHHKGLTYRNMGDPLRQKLDDSFLQATIVPTDGSDAVNEAIYAIFERLNSGGTQLTPHEIRVALYAGEFIAYLERLNQGTAWRALYGKPSARIRDQELILRVLALYLNGDEYRRPLKTFLNNFTAAHRQTDASTERAGVLFGEACERLHSGPGPDALHRPGSSQVNVAQAEAVLIGLMRGLERGAVAPDLAVAVAELVAEPTFVEATTRATADKDSVVARLERATEYLSSG